MTKPTLDEKNIIIVHERDVGTQRLVDMLENVNRIQQRMITPKRQRKTNYDKSDCFETGNRVKLK